MPTTNDQTAYLTLTQISGDPDQLLDGYRQFADVMEGVGRDHGLIFHAAASTDDGLLIVNLWPSREGSEAAARDRRRLSVIKETDLDAGQIRPVHHNVANYVLFE